MNIILELRELYLIKTYDKVKVNVFKNSINILQYKDRYNNIRII